MRTDLAARYGDERLPRYTSYPTAPHFGSAIGPEAYGDWLAGLPDGLSGSLYLHVPFCRAMCWYCGCNTNVARRDGPVEAFLALLRRELALVSERLPRPLPVRHVHFGGGTPTIVAPAAFLELMALLRRRFAIAAGAEIADRDRSPDPDRGDDDGPGRRGRHPCEPWRAELRPGGATGDQPRAELR